MEARAFLRSAKISPIKVREVISLVKGKSVDEALVLLKYSNRKASFILKKLLESAVANALEQGMDVDSFKVKNVTADDGIRMKRYRARAMGRAGRIIKRTSNITVIIGK
ncbi:50S ribosomal protein L22 [Hippea maritima]|uniref:Large ribosomal subunit protein uL22 n=1 Tax=Hippea maritima (strain ATCC 700847 / DSM 10411 / MH2) TaxID=760142 RepID=F2LXT7_HIPMA|nr:50S ribosomal protein L22 [Hippea maritima]AEA34328.1 ribosomal protein L22 [Hippea maritima DSM 10411]